MLVYEVLEQPLTIGSRVLKPGSKFTEQNWQWGKDALLKCVENGRCELVSPKEKEVEQKQESKKVQKKAVEVDEK